MNDITGEMLKLLPIEDLSALEWLARWDNSALPHQQEPEGDWSIWLMLCGRGGGKTFCAANTIGKWAWLNPGTRWLVSAPTTADLRSTCFEGASGLLNVIPPAIIQPTNTGGLWNSSIFELRLKNGSLIKGISAEEPERFRGPQFDGGWCDELCAWNNAQEAWDMIGFTMRLGDHPKILISTTPKPTPLIRDLVKREGKDVAITRASTYANAANLAKPFLDKLREQEGTKLGRQEIHAEILDAEEGGIIRRKWLRLWPANKPLPKFDFICVSFDTAFSEHDWNKKKQAADPTACTIWGVFYHEERKRMCVLLLDAWDDHLGFDDLRLKALAEAKSEWGTVETAYVSGKKVTRGRKPDVILVEAKGSGISLAQSLEREGVPVQRYDPGRLAKVTRLHMVSHLFANGVVYVPESSKNEGKPANWADHMIEQICSFAGEGSTQHDDWVDSTSQALLLLINYLQITVTPAEEREMGHEEDNPVEEDRPNPYAV
jgi:predicted phage terminase large subunit-like protein